MSNDWEDGMYLRTYTGKKFYPAKPEALEVDIIDIAHQLSLVNRYNGATEHPYPVAHHCLMVVEILEKVHHASPQVRLAGLLHDAEEAYLIDMTTPVKNLMPEYRQLSKQVRAHIFNELGLELPPPLVKEIDTNLRQDEMHQLTNWGDLEGCVGYYRLPIFPYRPLVVKNMFLKKYNELTEEIDNERKIIEAVSR